LSTVSTIPAFQLGALVEAGVATALFVLGKLEEVEDPVLEGVADEVDEKVPAGGVLEAVLVPEA
jgi:hypothetical protein